MFYPLLAVVSSTVGRRNVKISRNVFGETLRVTFVVRELSTKPLPPHRTRETFRGHLSLVFRFSTLFDGPLVLRPCTVTNRNKQHGRVKRHGARRDLIGFSMSSRSAQGRCRRTWPVCLFCRLADGTMVVDTFGRRTLSSSLSKENPPL